MSGYNNEAEIVEDHDYYVYLKLYGDRTEIRRKPLTPRFTDNIYKIKFRLRIPNNSALHIGSGLLAYNCKEGIGETVPANPPLDIVKRKNLPIIPGSTIKGFAVSAYRIAVNGCCLERCKTGTTGRRDDRNRRQNEREIRLCPLCDLFGTMGIGARVYFSDAVPAVNKLKIYKITIPKLMQPKCPDYLRDEFAVRFYPEIRFEPPESGDVAVYVIGPKAEFVGDILMYAESSEELDRLLVALFYIYPARMLLGMGKNIGLGKLDVIALSVEFKKNIMGEWRKIIDINGKERVIELMEEKLRGPASSQIRRNLLHRIHQLRNRPPYRFGNR